MMCTEKSQLQQKANAALDEYRRVEAELRHACEAYVATGHVRVVASRAERYREWMKACRALDRHRSTHHC